MRLVKVGGVAAQALSPNRAGLALSTIDLD
jgi:hypothetical protein